MVTSSQIIYSKSAMPQTGVLPMLPDSSESLPATAHVSSTPPPAGTPFTARPGRNRVEGRRGWRIEDREQEPPACKGLGDSSQPASNSDRCSTAPSLPLCRLYQARRSVVPPAHARRWGGHCRAAHAADDGDARPAGIPGHAARGIRTPPNRRRFAW
jgi:hypothetical protein